MVNFGPLAAEIISLVWGTPGNFNGFRVLAALLHGTLVVGVSQTAALNRGRHLYSAGRPSHWALAHILVVTGSNFKRPVNATQARSSVFCRRLVTVSVRQTTWHLQRYSWSNGLRHARHWRVCCCRRVVCHLHTRERMLCFSDMTVRSSVYATKPRGPKTDPLGTLHVTGNRLWPAWTNDRVCSLR